ncbi:MAG: hypothetical protein HY782_26820 [Chloroflexi bacterium]|nr:hypothetical protein [Chloroflexota bacterium]
MNTRRLVWQVALFLILPVLMAGTLACVAERAGPRAWIDYPSDGSRVPAGAPVAVVAHASAPDGVAEVLLSVNGAPYRRNPPAQPGATFSAATLDWFPQQEGEYVLQVTAFSKSGQATHARAVTVRAIGKSTPTPVPRSSSTPALGGRTITPVPTGTPDLEIVGVEAIFAGSKGITPICNTRVIYRNAGTAAVPRDFTIQFHFNGTPQLANTVAGGLASGATGEITFVYQFEGSPYIGINLDSTNVIAESNETNNAFAEARLCSGPTPVVSVTFTPTVTRAPTIGIQPPPPVTGCSGTPNIASFSASPATIERGQSATLSWGAVTNADSVSIEPGIGGVAAPGSTGVSPQNTTTYTLTARCGSNSITRQTTIQVNAPPPPATNTPTRTPTTKPPDTQGPPAPNLRSPKGSLSCRTSVTLDWDAVSDPSGIKHYIVKWTRNDGQSGGTVTSGTSHGISVTCGKSYSWSVQAVDNANNAGGTGSANFSIQPGLY